MWFLFNKSCNWICSTNISDVWLSHYDCFYPRRQFQGEAVARYRSWAAWACLNSTHQQFELFSSQTNETLQNTATKDLTTLEIKQYLLLDRRSLQDLWKGAYCLQTERKNGNGKKEWKKTSVTLFARIIHLHLPAFTKVKVLQPTSENRETYMQTRVSYVV